MSKTNSATLESLVQILNRLRAPDGCPWDLKQTPQTVKRYVIEEAYEVVDAIEEANEEAICEELGDLLFQILFMSRFFEEQGKFNIHDVIQSVSDKMIRRHPHIFGSTEVKDAEEVKANWDKIKAAEKKSQKIIQESMLDSIPRNIPPLEQARQIGEKVARVGFDWSDASEIVVKLEEEIQEFKEVLAKNDKKALQDEIGDLFLVVLNLARFLKIDPDESLRGAVKKFRFRFRHIEQSLKDKDLKEVPVEVMEYYWQDAKHLEK